MLLEHVKRRSPAAEVRTETAPVALDAGITVDQARSTAWPFAPHKGKPMGPLVDSQELSLKDLGYAIENAWDKQVRRAAAVLSAMRINQAVKEPPPPAGPLNTISGGRSYAQGREIRLFPVSEKLVNTLTLLMRRDLVESAGAGYRFQIELGRPWFDREERSLFLGAADTGELIAVVDERFQHYNTKRRHSSIGNLPPLTYIERVRSDFDM